MSSQPPLTKPLPVSGETQYVWQTCLNIEDAPATPYQQHFNPQLLDADARLLWRFPARRLEAEAIRDTMLAVSGQLDLKMFGRGYNLFAQRGGLSGFTPVESFTGDGLRRMQELERRIQIVGEVDTMRSAVESARRLSPQVILMDVRLPDGDGIEACRQIKKFLPATHVLFLTSFADNQFVLASMEAGGDGYLLKESGAQRIVDAIHSILDGGTVFDPIVTRAIISDLRSGGGSNPLDALAARERRVLAEVAKGKTDKEVAVALNLTTKTARNYLDRIFTKLNVHTRTEAALLHVRFGEKSRALE